MTGKGQRSLTVAHLLWGLEMGGIQRSLISLALHSPPEEAAHLAIGFHSGLGARPALESAGCRVIELGKARGVDLPALRRLAGHLRRESPDVMHMHDFTGCFWGMRAAGRSAVPVRVATLHSGMRGLSPLKKALYLRLLRRMDRVIVLSESTRRRLEAAGIAAGRLVMCPLGPEPFAGTDSARKALRREMGIAEGETVVLTCARLEREKNLLWLVDLAAALKGSDRRFRFLLAGEGSQRSRIEKRLKSRGIEGRFHLLGLRRDVPALLAAADIFVLASLSEELPVSVLEAMAAGLPVVVTPVGGTPELVTESGKNGFLAPLGIMSVWVDRLETLATEPELRRRVGEAARETIRERFDLHSNVESLLRLYRELENHVLP